MRGIGIENGRGKKGEIGFKGERLKEGRGKDVGYGRRD